MSKKMIPSNPKGSVRSSKLYTYKQVNKKAKAKQKSRKKYNRGFNWDALFDPDATGSKMWRLYGTPKRK